MNTHGKDVPRPVSGSEARAIIDEMACHAKCCRHPDPGGLACDVFDDVYAEQKGVNRVALRKRLATRLRDFRRKRASRVTFSLSTVIEQRESIRRARSGPAHEQLDRSKDRRQGCRDRLGGDSGWVAKTHKLLKDHLTLIEYDILSQRAERGEKAAASDSRRRDRQCDPLRLPSTAAEIG